MHTEVMDLRAISTEIIGRPEHVLGQQGACAW